MDSLGDSFSVTLLTGPGPPVMLLRSREGRKADQQKKKSEKQQKFQFPLHSGGMVSTKSGGVVDETLQNHHPSPSSAFRW